MSVLDVVLVVVGAMWAACGLMACGIQLSLVAMCLWRKIPFGLWNTMAAMVVVLILGPIGTWLTLGVVCEITQAMDRTRLAEILGATDATM